MKWLIAVILFACRTPTKITVDDEGFESGIEALKDNDGDGYLNDEDCDDNDAATHPGALEICDGLDNNCDGQTDEGVTETYYADSDGDGFGDVNVTLEACESPDGFIPIANDCDDSNPDVNPGAAEICDGLDNNCDGVSDDMTTNWYADTDGDGFGDPDSQVSDCDPGNGFVANNLDCNDSNGDVNPLAIEICDESDNDCDGSIDEGVTQTFYYDGDGDGYGGQAETADGCVPPPGYVATSSDCNDMEYWINPGATEVCDGIDNNCDGGIDDNTALAQNTYYTDADGDGYGDPLDPITACELPLGASENADDCDDSNSGINPSAIELCDGIDQNCDGSVDEGLSLPLWYADADGDGFGEPSALVESCTAPVGYVANGLDCNDMNANVSPLATETCNGIDDNCDGLIDGPTASDALMWFIDIDGDGHGSPQFFVLDCTQPTGWSELNDDCDDTNPDVNPLATELCNGIDDDCDGIVDSLSLNTDTFYADADCDGYGDPLTSIEACSAPVGYVSDNTDCDDNDPRTNPMAEELCLSSGSVDNNCNGIPDDNCLTVVELNPPTHSPLPSPDFQGGCGTFADVNVSLDTHDWLNLPQYMSAVENASSVTTVNVDALDYSTRCNSNFSASPGNYPTTTQPWANNGYGLHGAARLRGFLHIGCGDNLNKTIGLIGNDSVTLTIGGQLLMFVNWNDGQWKKFRHVSFPEPGLYPYEIEWSTNFNCDYDPMEVVWADGFLSGYGAYDSMCSWGTCVYGNGQPIPGFSVIDSWNLLQSSAGIETNCEQCDVDQDCPFGQLCNTAGICDYSP